MKDRKYNTIAGYRLAISAFHNPIDGCKVGDHPRESALVKGIFNLKPPKSRYPFICDMDQVLNYLNSLTVGSNLKNSTYKLVMLLALTAAARASEITHLEICLVLLFYFNEAC